MRRGGVWRWAFSVAAKFDRSTVLVAGAPGRTVVSEALVPLAVDPELPPEPDPDVVAVEPPLEPDVVAVEPPGGGGGGAATSTVATDDAGDGTPADDVAPARMATTW